MAKKVYDEKFRSHLVSLVRAGRTAESLAKEFEPSAPTIRAWVEAEAQRLSGATPEDDKARVRALGAQGRRARRRAGDPKKSRGLVRQGERVRPKEGYPFVKAHQAEHRVTTLCRVLELSRQGYYAWAARGPSAHEVADERLLADVREAHLATRGIYGAPRIHAQLARKGVRTSCKRVARLMRSAGLTGVTRRSKHVTTVRDPSERPAPDLVDRKFVATAPDELWVADITHIPMKSGAFYLAIVLDVFTRKVVGWATRTDMEAALVIEALELAVARRRPVNVIHHSDQGSQYTSRAFAERCKLHNVRLSMGSVGDCFDNAMAESFNATLEVELLDLVAGFADPVDADAQLFSYIEGFYNTRRLHSALGMRSPVEAEREAAQSAGVPGHPQGVSLPLDPLSQLGKMVPLAESCATA